MSPRQNCCGNLIRRNVIQVPVTLARTPVSSSEEKKTADPITSTQCFFFWRQSWKYLFFFKRHSWVSQKFILLTGRNRYAFCFNNRRIMARTYGALIFRIFGTLISSLLRSSQTVVAASRLLSAAAASSSFHCPRDRFFYFKYIAMMLEEPGRSPS